MFFKELKKYIFAKKLYNIFKFNILKLTKIHLICLFGKLNPCRNY